MSALSDAVLRISNIGSYTDSDQRRRARILTAAAALGCAVGLLRGTLFLSSGSLYGGGLLYAAAAGFALVLFGLWRSWSLVVVGNILVSIMFVVCGIMTLYRGGVGSPVLAGIGIVPLLATLAAGWRSGMVWMLLSALAVLLISMVPALPDQVPPPAQRSLDTAATLVIPIVMTIIGVAYEWAKAAALDERAAAELGRRVAVEDARLLRADRMTSMGVLAAGVGHEINNPLTFVLANYEFLQEDLHRVLPADHPDREDLLALTTEGLEGAHRIRLIVQDLRNFSRDDADERARPFPIARALSAALKLTRHHYKHHAEVSQDLQPALRVLGEEHRLVQVFVNLLLNASHALRAHAVEDGQIHVSTAQDGDRVIVTVRDNGPGISLENQRQIFTPFFTTRARDQGTGLGLSVSLGIARDHGGDLTVQSTPGEGASFALSLPIYVAPAEEVEDRADIPSPPVRALQVLIVDDEVQVTVALSRMLSGHTVSSVHSAEEAVLFLMAQDVDLILCDLTMRGMSGMELFYAIQQEKPSLTDAFVFITGGVFTPETQHFVDTVARPVLRKPILKTDIAAVIAQFGPSS